MNGNYHVKDVLSRLETGEDSDASFIPSSTFRGAKQGYYFGTNAKGTGYYIDAFQQENQSKKRKRSVKIAEEHNDTKFLPGTLLERAEREASGSTVIELTPKGLQSASNALTKIVNQNAMQRARFSNEPRQYMNSELSLYEQLTALQAVAANAQLYQHLVDDTTLVSTLIELLGHENADVCAVTAALFFEWIDPTLVLQDDDMPSVMGSLAGRILTEAWEMIVINLSRFQSQASQNGNSVDEDDTQDQTLKGIENSLSLMENLLELDLIIPGGLLGESLSLSAAAYMVKVSHIVPWLFQQLQNEGSNEVKGRSIELLSFLAQKEDVFTILPDWSELSSFSSTHNVVEDDQSQQQEKKKAKVESLQGIEILLQAIGRYRKIQPKDDQEVEFLENACVLLSSCISFSTKNLSAFLEGQGIELVLRCLKECVHAGASALKLLDFYGGEAIHKEACEHLVKAGGLKFLFPMLLGSRIPKPALLDLKTASKKAKRKWLLSIQAQIIRIIYALSRYLDDESPEDAKARFLTKFAEDDRKCDRLVELLLMYDQKARKAEYNFYRSDVEEQVQEEETIQLAAMDAKLKGGGELFHRLGAISGFVCVNSKRCHERLLSQLQMQQSGIGLVKAAVEEFSNVLGQGEQKDQLVQYLNSI